MQIVKCNACGRWIGRKDEIGFETVNEPGIEYCPECGCLDALMNVDNNCKFDDSELERLWEMFGYVPVNDNDEIQEDFLGFPEGTDRIELWHWFDEQYSKGVEKLVYT